MRRSGGRPALRLIKADLFCVTRSISCAETDGGQGANITAQVSLSIGKLRVLGGDAAGRPLALVSGSRNKGLVTSRSPDDIPAFNPEVIRLFAGGRGKQRAA